MPRRAMTVQKYREQKQQGFVENKEMPTPQKDEMNVVKSYVKVVKLDKDERKVTGVVLEPDVFDAQKTTITREVIRKAAHKYLAGYNKTTKLGLQHEDFKKPFELCESFIAPCDLVINTAMVTNGSWVITVKVLSKPVWDKIKNGKIKGFSIGGTAKVKKLEKVKK